LRRWRRSENGIAKTPLRCRSLLGYHWELGCMPCAGKLLRPRHPRALPRLVTRMMMIPRVATVLHIGSSATVHRSQDWSCHICQQCRKWRDVFVRLLGRNNPGGVATDDISDPFGILYILMSAIYIFFRISSIGISDLCTTSRLATAD
jgi:hypothetical protein